MGIFNVKAWKIRLNGKLWYNNQTNQRVVDLVVLYFEGVRYVVSFEDIQKWFDIMVGWVLAMSDSVRWKVSRKSQDSKTFVVWVKLIAILQVDQRNIGRWKLPLIC